MHATIYIKIKKLFKKGHKIKGSNTFDLKPQGIKFIKRQTLIFLKTKQ